MPWFLKLLDKVPCITVLKTCDVGCDFKRGVFINCKGCSRSVYEVHVGKNIIISFKG